MVDITREPVWRFRAGNVTSSELEKALTHIYRGVLSKMDVRFAQWEGSAGLVVNSDGEVVVKSGTTIDGRTGSSLPTVLQRIGNNGTASDSRLINLVNYANRNSVQSADDILTSTSGASTSTINVAAHTVKFDYGTVSYGSGSISGLSTNTAYLIYADDTTPPTGGAVSYVATTNPSDLIATGRYYVGTITTAIAATAGSISAATTANPIVCTTGSAHGWTTGDSVTFSGMTGGFSALNGNTYTITVTGATTFTIAVDGTAYAAYAGGGSATRVSTSTQGGGGAGAGGGGTGGIWDGYLP